MERPNKENYWLEPVKQDGYVSIPFDHYRYETDLEIYCNYLEKQLEIFKAYEK